MTPSQPGSQPTSVVDPQAYYRALERAAPVYDDAALLAHEVRGRMLERLELMRVDPARILVVDGRAGADQRALRRALPRAETVLLDPSPAMVRQARRRRIWRRRQRFAVAWASALPLPSGSAGLLWSNLGLPWVTDLDRCLREIHRVLAAEGLLLFSSLGPDTLAELREAWIRVIGREPAWPPYLDMHDVGDALSRAGLEGVVMENEVLTVTYPDLPSLLRDLRRTGTGALLADRRRGLLTPRRLRALEEALPREEGRIPARFEVVYGHAWRPSTAAVGADHGGTARIGIDQIGRASGAGAG